MDNNKIVQALYEVKDPVVNADIIKTGRVKNLRLEGDKIYFELLVHGLNTEQKGMLNMTCQQALQQLYPDAQIHIHMLTDKKQAQDVEYVPQIKQVIAIASGKGGVGKSTVCAGIARAMRAQGLNVGVLDADLYGPSMPTIFGMEGQRPQVYKNGDKVHLIPLQSDEGIYVMSIGFVVEPQQAVVLRGPRLAGVLKQFIQECQWPELDVLLVDLPPGTGDVQLTLVQTVALTGAVIVSTPQKLAYVDALKAMNMFRMESIQVPILGVVENMAWFTPAELPENKYYIFGEGSGARLAKEGETELLGQVPIELDIRAFMDDPLTSDVTARSNKYFTPIVERLEKQIAKRNEQLGPTKRVEVK